MGNLLLNEVVLGILLLIVLIYREKVQAASSYDFRIAIALDSTKMTSQQEFQDQKTLVTKLLTRVFKSKNIEFAIAVYTADKSQVFKDFDGTKTVNLTNVDYLKTSHYGFDTKKLFGLRFKERPDCIFFIRNHENYTHPECNSTYAPMGYPDPVTKIALRFGRPREEYLKRITGMKDILASGLLVNDSIHNLYNFNNIITSILNNCKKYHPPPTTATSSAILTSSSFVSYHTQEILMTSTKTVTLRNNTGYTVVPYSIQPSVTQTSTPATSLEVLVTSVPTCTNTDDLDRLREEYKEFLNYDIKRTNLSDDAEFDAFIQRASRLLSNIHVLDSGREINGTSYGLNVSEQLGKFCISVAENMIKNGLAGKLIEVKTKNLVVHISSLNVSVFSGYEFGDAVVEKGKVRLPMEIFKKEENTGLGAVVVMIFDPFKPFTDGRLIKGNSNTTIVGKIINVEVLPRPSNPLEKPVTIQVQARHSVEGKDPNCVIWQTSLSGWSTQWCSVSKMDGNVTECQCSHMTHYAVLMSLNEDIIPKKHSHIMTIVTYIGCSLSITGIFLTIITFLCLPVLRSDRTRIHCNLCFAIGSAQTMFLAAGSEELTQRTTACKLYAAVMFYFFISVFTWMLVEGIHLYQMIIIAFVSRPMMKFYYALGWGLPAVIVVIASAIGYKGYGTPYFCWISLRDGTIWAFIGPAACIILVNIFVLISVLWLRVKLDGSNDVRHVAKTGARVSIVLLPLLGMTWIFGFFSVVPGFAVVFQYLFAITNSLQGLMVFVFHCIGNSEVRKEFFRKTAQWNLMKSLSSTTPITVATNKVEPIYMESFDANHKED